MQDCSYQNSLPKKFKYVRKLSVTSHYTSCSPPKSILMPQSTVQDDIYKRLYKYNPPQSNIMTNSDLKHTFMWICFLQKAQIHTSMHSHAYTCTTDGEMHQYKRVTKSRWEPYQLYQPQLLSEHDYAKSISCPTLTDSGLFIAMATAHLPLPVPSKAGSHVPTEKGACIERSDWPTGLLLLSSVCVSLWGKGQGSFEDDSPLTSHDTQSERAPELNFIA